MFKPDLSGEDREDTPAREAPVRLGEILTYDCFTLVRIGLLTCLAMVPLVTIPPAYMAMNTLVRQVLQGKPVRCRREFWPAFKAGFLRSYGVFFLSVLLPVLSLICAVFYAGQVEKQPLLFALCVFSIVVFALSALSAPHLYSLTTAGVPLAKAVRESVLLGCANPLRAFFATLIHNGLLLFGVAFLPLSVPYFLLGGLSVPCLIGQFLVRPVLLRYRPEGEDTGL